MSSLSDISDDSSSILSDPSYYDRTNPASPFYDATLDPNCTNSNVIAALEANKPTVETANVVDKKTDRPVDSVLTAEESAKSRRKGVRQMVNTLQQEQYYLEAKSKTPDLK